MAQEDELRQLREAKAAFREQLLANPDVHGIGIGYKRKAGKKTKTLAVVIHVHRKQPNSEIAPARFIPPKLDFYSTSAKKRISVPTDIVEKAPPQPEVCGPCNVNFGTRVRPVPGGFSFGRATEPGGTLGGYVWDRTTDQSVFLSNHHVIGGTAGDTIIQPSIGDLGSSPADNFGAVIRAGRLDCAIGSATDSADTELAIECSTAGVFEITDAILGMEVEKVGQTTGLTCGVVELIDYDSNHYGSHVDLWIDGDGSDFSQSGDSGSLYVERTHPDGSNWKRIVGIHWGGSGNDAVGHPIRAVFDDLNLTTLCDGIITNLIEALFGPESEAEEALPRNTHKGIARDFEAVILKTKVGSKALELLRRHRVDAVGLLAKGDGRRAAIAALAPILKGKFTVAEILDHQITTRDLANFKRVLAVSEESLPKAKPLTTLAGLLLKRAEGKTLRSVLFGKLPQ